MAEYCAVDEWNYGNAWLSHSLNSWHNPYKCNTPCHDMTKNIPLEKIVPDTCILVEALVSAQVEKKQLSIKEIIIHEATLAELEHQANAGKAIGFIGLDEIKHLREMADQKLFTLRFSGRRPSAAETRMAAQGEIDALIRQLAYEEDATLLTADHVQAKTAEARGIKVLLFHNEKNRQERSLQIETFFDTQTMSVHLREGVTPFAKKGVPGKWEFVMLSEKELTEEDLKKISSEIITEANSRKDSFLELERDGSTIAQLGPYRIVILHPPLSDGWEITAVRPVKKLSLDDYKLSEKLKQRIAAHAEGVLVAGAPGQGKTTFAQALAEYYAAKGKIVKTIEAPRDMVLPQSITQLSVSKATPEELHDILLLTRPDYTVFDEMRNTKDFALFADLRLAGVGLIGVIHATKALDAIQRFIGRTELGVIPHVIDTILFIKEGTVHTVLSIQMLVKVPEGMTEADLARPVVVVSDFETEKPVAELYSYGEETVVVPVTEHAESGARKLAAKTVEHALQRFSTQVKVELTGDHNATVYVPEKDIGAVIGKEGATVTRLEKELGLHLDVRALTEKVSEQKKVTGNQVPFELEYGGKHVEIFVNAHVKDVHLYVGSTYLASFNIGKKGIIRIKKSNSLGKTLMNAIDADEQIRVMT